ncbi:restriction endonuclease subunit S [Hydrogenimonas cancrithermarum]|nr:restriction endonuclease subunit S [Hydrogenimonas cancrithermarum]
MIPEEWEVVKLGDFLKLKGGNAFKSKDFQKIGIPVLKISNILSSGNIDLSNCVKVKEDKKYNLYLLNEQDIVIAMSGATTGKIGKIKKEHLPLYLNQRVGKFDITNPSRLYSQYLYYNVTDSRFIEKLLVNAIGGAQPNISSRQIENLYIPLPSLPEQQKIAAILTSVDKKIEVIDEQIAKTEELKKGLMQKLLSEGIGHTEFKESEIGRIPKEWEVSTIGEVVVISIGRDLQEEHFSKKKTATHIYPVFSNTVDNQGLYGYYDFKEFEGQSLTVVGRGIGVGTAFTKNGGYGAIGRLIVLFPTKKIYPHFLTEYINYKIRIFSESSGIPQLTGKAIAKYKCPVPPIEEQQKIATILSSTDNKLDALRERKIRYETLKKGLMQKLLMGEVRVKV